MLTIEGPAAVDTATELDIDTGVEASLLQEAALALDF